MLVKHEVWGTLEAVGAGQNVKGKKFIRCTGNGFTHEILISVAAGWVTETADLIAVWHKFCTTKQAGHTKKDWNVH